MMEKAVEEEARASQRKQTSVDLKHKRFTTQMRNCNIL
jgi:hypothetical protein